MQEEEAATDGWVWQLQDRTSGEVVLHGRHPLSSRDSVGQDEAKALVQGVQGSVADQCLRWDLQREFSRGVTTAAEGTVRWVSNLAMLSEGRLTVDLVPGLSELVGALRDIVPSLLNLPLAPAVKKWPHGFDSLVDPWVDAIPDFGDKVPSAYRVWQSSHRYYRKGDIIRAKECERLNYLLHNSQIPCEVELPEGTTFAYGGIGVILHKDTEFGRWCTIGANSTIGGNGSPRRRSEKHGREMTVPMLGDLVTLGAGINVTGGIEVGGLSIVAPNCVLTKSVEPGSIVGGIPGKVLRQLDLDSVLRYQHKFLPARTWSRDEFGDRAKEVLG